MSTNSFSKEHRSLTSFFGREDLSADDLKLVDHLRQHCTQLSCQDVADDIDVIMVHKDIRIHILG